jgi:hypothetical protein
MISEYPPVRRKGVEFPFSEEMTRRWRTGFPASSVVASTGSERLPPEVRFMGAG